MSEFDSKRYLATLTTRPGVYQMFDLYGDLLYVGKAKNLKSRVSSYFRSRGLTAKTVALVNKINRIEVTVTQSETEALLLEHNLIRQYRPPYNILLKDDKSYPYIFLSTDDEYPRLSMHRGAKRKAGKYFGPYPNAGAVRESLDFLQKVFQVRQCEDSYFKNRTRPCLQFQIGRCLAPCDARVTPSQYRQAVDDTAAVLLGDNENVTTELAQRMETAALALQFEEAARYRDQIQHLRSLQERQFVSGESGDIDVIALAHEHGSACIQHVYIRKGQIIGSRSYFPKLRLDETGDDILAAYIAQRYLASDSQFSPPTELILSQEINDIPVFEKAISQHLKRRINVRFAVRSERAKWVSLATSTAQQNLRAHLNDKLNLEMRFNALAEALELDEAPSRMECFDISHSSGELTVASCVVFDQNGAAKSDYRRFNIDGITGGDDYAAMRQAIERRYRRLRDSEAKLPDLLVIDGGKGQVQQALDMLEELQVIIPVLGVAKGTTRKAGFETLVLPVGDRWRELVLDGDHPALHLLQQIRDEAHRFAITGHRQRRGKARRTSALEGIDGVGPKRRKALLNHFGGMQGVQRATIDDLLAVPGINRKTAEEIYHALRGKA